jgi:hypothetical protein
MAVFIEKLPFTRFNCYEPIKNTSLLIKLGPGFNMTIAFVTACSSIISSIISCYSGNGGRLKITKIQFCFDFAIKTDFKVLKLHN